MAQRAPMLGVYLRAEEYQQLSEDAKKAGFKSPAIYLRALYREQLQSPEIVQRAIATKQYHDLLTDNAARLTAQYLQSLTLEELTNALSRKV